MFVILHGLVYLLYLGQSSRLFELRPGMTWPDGAWAFSRLLGKRATRWLASFSCALAASGFVTGGIGMLANAGWWNDLIVYVAVFSAAIPILFWDGKMQKLHDKGAIGLVINMGILAALLIPRWPPIGS
jgi:hypothetical protein